VHNIFYTERLVKFLLWARGGWKVTIGGPPDIAAAIAQAYAPQGARVFDYQFMGEIIYQQPFTVVNCTAEDAPPEDECQQTLGRHLDGCRIGFDLGASDLKVSALIDGQVIFSHEMEWQPRQQSDPAYHYDKIIGLLKMAAKKLPRVDAIGGSSAGVVINNRLMIASLFRGIPPERYDEVRNLFLNIGKQMGAPIEVANDGEVSALAGSMSLNENAVLGIALGSSLAGGYITAQGNITNWLNELAFTPVDYQPNAPVEEWSGDKGVSALYLSQQCVFRLAPRVGIAVPAEASLAQKLKSAQNLLEDGHAGARQIWETIGIYLGYAIAHYASFYDLTHVLILGRVTSGLGGAIILERANQVLQAEFPQHRQIHLELPDEMSRRLGQSIAAASLPKLTEKGTLA
jgi:predicted NBD/HSP70 family sugar kinase